MVYDVAATNSGALSVLNEFYNLASDVSRNNCEFEWYFVISTPNFKSSGNITVIKKPWVHKSWLHRVFFERFILKKICQKNKIDRIVSLQNVGVDSIKVPQIIYYHNSIPFNDFRFKFTENKRFWVYQNVIKYIYQNSLRNAYKIITQTDSMKNSIIKNVCIDGSKVVSARPNIRISDKYKLFKYSNNTYNRFFYPATAYDYKNHMTILRAFKLLSEEGIKNYIVYFTITTFENEYTKKLYNYVLRNKLNVKFIGKIDRNKVFEYYSNSILLFPSYIESCPFPLIEAQHFNTFIISSTCDFSQEILSNYNNARFFNYNNDLELNQQIKLILSGKDHHSQPALSMIQDDDIKDIILN